MATIRQLLACLFRPSARPVEADAMEGAAELRVIVLSAIRDLLSSRAHYAWRGYADATNDVSKAMNERAMQHYHRLERAVEVALKDSSVSVDWSETVVFCREWDDRAEREALRKGLSAYRPVIETERRRHDDQMAEFADQILAMRRAGIQVCTDFRTAEYEEPERAD